jgi:hypothetical protein
MVPVVLLGSLLATQTPRWDGVYEGTGGFPLRPGVTELQTFPNGTVKVTWRFQDGQSGTAESPGDGKVLTFTNGQFRCALAQADGGARLQGKCTEMLRAEARAPMEMPWDGVRVVGPPAVLLPGILVLVPAGWEWAYQGAGQARLLDNSGTVSVVVDVKDAGPGDLDALTADLLKKLLASQGRGGRVVKSQKTTVQTVPARQLLLDSGDGNVGHRIGLVVTIQAGRVMTVMVAAPTAQFDQAWKTAQPVLSGIRWR